MRRLCGPRRRLYWREKRWRATPLQRHKRRGSPLCRPQEKFLPKEECARRSFRPKGAEHNLLPCPSISADKMQANSKAGRVLYTGHARLWQGDSVMEADAIELLRDAR